MEQEENKNIEEKEKTASNENTENTGEEIKQNDEKNYDELNDRYMRVMAEFENFKKRSQKERELLYNSIFGRYNIKNITFDGQFRNCS